MKTVKYFARHETLKVAAGFDSKELRDVHVASCVGSNHPWRICTEEEALSCAEPYGSYQVFFADSEERPEYSGKTIEDLYV